MTAQHLEHLAPGASTAQAKLVRSIRYVTFWLFWFFGFCLEKLSLPLVAPSKAGRSLSCVFDVISIRGTMYELCSFSIQELIVFELHKQRREIMFNIQKLHGLHLRKIVLDEREPTCSRGGDKRYVSTNKLCWRSVLPYSLKHTCSLHSRWDSYKIWMLLKVQSQQGGLSRSHTDSLARKFP